MKSLKFFVSIFLILLFIQEDFFIFPAKADFDVKGVQLFKDNNVCIIMSSGGTLTTQALDLSTLQTNSESVQSKVSSGGSLCSLPPFFNGGALLTTTNGITIQAEPTVQGLGRGILISEIAGNSSGVSSSGDPIGFSSLITRLGTLATSIFEISLPTGCDVIDDDDDVVGASSDLSTINDFSFPTCTSTNGLSVQCNTEINLLTAMNALVPVTSSAPAKIRFAISAFDSIPDTNMIDSILIKLDSQDIFCQSNISGPLTATVIAKNAIDNPTKQETLGTADLGTPTQAVKISYASESTTSLKGEVSTNQVNTTPLLIGGAITTANIIQIEELHNEGIPIGGQSSPVLINPSVSSTSENSIVNLWIVPSSTGLFFNSPSSSDITFSDDSLILNSAPYVVRTNADDLNAPFGTLVIPLKKNLAGTDPQTVKTKITVNNLRLSSASSSTMDGTLLLSLFEPVSGSIVNTPAALSVNNSTNTTNPQNFSAFSTGSTRALVQNAVVSGAVNEATAASQITTDTDLSALTSRNTTLGAPQITGFTKAISSLTQADTNKITISSTNSVLTTAGTAGASVGGAKVKIESFANGSMTAFDSVTITSNNDGSFTAKLQADFSSGDVTVNFKQTVSASDSTVASKIVSKQSSSGSSGLPCDKTVCGCANPNCTPTIVIVLNYIQNNGGLASIVSKGGDSLDEIIKAAKKALGLS